MRAALRRRPQPVVSSKRSPFPMRKARRITPAEALGIAPKTVVAPVHRCYRHWGQFPCKDIRISCKSLRIYFYIMEYYFYTVRRNIKEPAAA